MDTQSALSVHLLIVDDDPDTVRLMKHVLAKDGHHVSAATSGADVLSRLEASLRSNDPIRLVLLDLMMPGIDGLEVLRRMRDNPRLASIPAIVVTAAYSPTQEIDGLNAGADDFIAKPYQPQVLLARVRTVLRTRHAEETAGRAKALEHVLIEGMRDLVFVVDDQGRFSYVSPSAELLSGYMPAELTSGQITLEWLVHPADHERARAHMQSAQNDENVGEIEFRIVRKDGTPRWAAMSVTPLRDASAAGLQGILRDVTARHQAEETLRTRSEELAALNLLAGRVNDLLDPQAMLAESLATLMDVIDAQFSIAYLLENEQLYITTWHGLSEAMLAEAGSPEFMQHLRLEKAEVHRELEHQETGQIPPVAKAEGVQSWVSLPLRGRGHPVGSLVFASREYDRFDDAAIDFLAAASEQIALGLRNAQLFAETQRRARELELINQVTHAASSTLNLQTVLQTIMTQAVEVLQAEAGSVMLLEKPEGDLVFAVAAGPAGEQLRGTHVPVATSIAGQAIREGRSLIVGDVQRDMHFFRQVDRVSGLTTQSLLATPLSVHGRIIGVLEVINKRSSRFSMADLALLEALAGPAATAIENARLYEEALRHAEEIQRSQAQLIHSEKLAATGRLAVSLAHEINNPLQALQNLLFLALDKRVGHDKRHEFLEVARDETSRLITLVQQTLEFYRPAHASPGPVDVNAAVERVLALARKKLQHSNVQVELKLSTHLPRVQGAADQIAQVFLNLIVNAAEAMSDGGSLRIESRADATHVQVTFADSGPGIAPEDVPHIFEPFYSTKDSGTGLGLAVSYNIIESHGGTLSVASIPGHGATFTVRLPAAVAPEAAPTQRRKKRSTRDVERKE